MIDNRQFIRKLTDVNHDSGAAGNYREPHWANKSRSRYNFTQHQQFQKSFPGVLCGLQHFPFRGKVFKQAFSKAVFTGGEEDKQHAMKLNGKPVVIQGTIAECVLRKSNLSTKSTPEYTAKFSMTQVEHKPALWLPDE